MSSQAENLKERFAALSQQFKWAPTPRTIKRTRRDLKVSTASTNQYHCKMVQFKPTRKPVRFVECPSACSSSITTDDIARGAKPKKKPRTLSISIRKSTVNRVNAVHLRHVIHHEISPTNREWIEREIVYPLCRPLYSPLI